MKNKIQFHTEAESNFNKKATTLVETLKERLDEKVKCDSFKSDRPFIELTPDKIIGDKFGSSYDVSGEEVSVFLVENNMQIGLFDNTFVEFIKFCENVQKSSGVKNYCSLSLIKKITFQWLLDIFRKKTEVNYTDFLIEKLEVEIVTREIWVPLFQTTIESELQFADILIKPMSKSLFDNWVSGLIDSKNKEQSDQIIIQFEKYRNDFQGVAACVINVTADFDKAAEYSIKKTEEVLDFLRLFSAASFHPLVKSYFTISGMQHHQTYQLFEFSDNILKTVSHNSIDKSFQPWSISSDFIRQIKHDGIDVLAKLYSKNDKSKFEQTILEFIKTYSKSLLYQNLSDRLLYSFISIESILLLNQSESIIENASKRFAFCIGRTAQQRKEISSNFKSAYGLRSKFVHHGQYVEIEDLGVLKIFITNLWFFFLSLIHQYKAFNTKEEFIHHLEDKIFK